MSLYQCEECGCVENTACGWYHYTKHNDPKYKGRKLCSACSPTHFSDGSVNEHGGKWHGLFERKFYPKGTLETDEKGNIRKKATALKAGDK